MRTNLRSVTVLLVALVAMAACSGGSNGTAPHPPPPPAKPEQPTPTPIATVAPHAPNASGKCVNGWSKPQPGSDGWTTALGVIERATGMPGPFQVRQIRYFEGSESPPSDMNYLGVVKRWYVKAIDTADPSFRARFLVEKRQFGAGLVAVAPFATHGFSSPDWVGFQLNTADPTPSPYPGLPGRWDGIPYNFVLGGKGLTIPGLPAGVAGCLRGT